MRELVEFITSSGVQAEYFINGKVLSVRAPVCRNLFTTPKHLVPDLFIPEGYTRDTNEVVRFEFMKKDEGTFLIIRIPILEGK